ncbi:5368_t:CDS:2, partial [Funneliformis mosseae]
MEAEMEVEFDSNFYFGVLCSHISQVSKDGAIPAEWNQTLDWQNENFDNMCMHTRLNKTIISNMAGGHFRDSRSRSEPSQLEALLRYNPNHKVSHIGVWH